MCVIIGVVVGDIGFGVRSLSYSPDKDYGGDRTLGSFWELYFLEGVPRVTNIKSLTLH